MAVVVSLDSIRESIETKYAPLEVQVGDGKSVHLVQSLRLDKGKRGKVQKLLTELNDLTQSSDAEDGGEAEMLRILRDILSLAASTPAEGKTLVGLVGEDSLVMLELVTEWANASQPGEAAPSAT